MSNFLKNNRALTAKVAGLGLLLTGCCVFAGFCWIMKTNAEANLAQTHDRLEAQRVLSPYVKNIRTRQQEVANLLRTEDSKPVPRDLRAMLGTLQTMAEEAGLPGTQFVPDGVSVVGRSDIRLIGHTEGSTEAFRRFILALSNQRWIQTMNTFTAKAGDPANTLDFTVTALFSLPDDTVKTAPDATKEAAK